ncbi:hypothetical protein EJD97_025449 [Solanum chilense]|uniref:Uncharacterized protein n=1 Tax=Solanum chilense TaxID=4083 RepID=A0A6N2C7R0_SOLCI|nr:hypothetical protein EJD97_025449 [Solanum chilense]
MKNHEARPAESAPLSEAHAVEARVQSEIRQNNRDLHGREKGKRRLYRHSFKWKENTGDAFSCKARVESHLTLKDDVQAGSSQKYNENVEANLALKDNVFDGLDDITHLEAEDFFGDQN